MQRRNIQIKHGTSPAHTIYSLFSSLRSTTLHLPSTDCDQVPSIRSRHFHALFSHLCNSIVKFSNGWKTMTQVERARELAEKRTIGKTFPLYDLNVKETNPYVQLVYYVCWNSFGSSSHSCVCVRVFYSLCCYSIGVCLFVQFPFSVCISLIYTDKSISVPLRTHYVLWLFSIYLCCAPAFFHSRSLLSFARLIAEAAFTFHLI